MNYWLMKSEPDVFGIDHLKAMPKKTELLSGIAAAAERAMAALASGAITLRSS